MSPRTCPAHRPGVLPPVADRTGPGQRPLPEPPCSRVNDDRPFLRIPALRRCTAACSAPTPRARSPRRRTASAGALSRPAHSPSLPRRHEPTPTLPIAPVRVLHSPPCAATPLSLALRLARKPVRRGSRRFRALPALGLCGQSHLPPHSPTSTCRSTP